MVESNPVTLETIRTVIFPLTKSVSVLWFLLPVTPKAFETFFRFAALLCRLTSQPSGQWLSTNSATDWPAAQRIKL